MSYGLETRKKIVESLKETPVIEAACKKHGVSRATFYRWVRLAPQFATDVEQALSHGRDRYNDVAESVILKGVQNQDFAAAKYWLSHNSDRYRTHAPIGRSTAQHSSQTFVNTVRPLCRCPKTQRNPAATSQTMPTPPCKHEIAYEKERDEERLLQIIDKFITSLGKHPRDMCDEELDVLHAAVWAEYSGDYSEYEALYAKNREDPLWDAIASGEVLDVLDDATDSDEKAA